MSDTKIAAQLERLRSRVEPLEKLLHALAEKLPQPLWYHSGKQHFGFRYGKPDVRHFCLLKAVRAVSALNAAIELAGRGYAQEIFVLMRTIFEYTSHIEFVLSAPDGTGELTPAAAKYVQEFFDDYERNDVKDFKRAEIRQGTVHKQLGAELDKWAHESGRDPTKEKAAQLYSNIYLTCCNYVHGKYPEIMDLYGGKPGHFHLRGMSGTPKDAENMAFIEAAVGTVANTLVQMISRLKLHGMVDSDPALSTWFRSTLELDVDRRSGR
jgi:hypothetical protein